MSAVGEPGYVSDLDDQPGGTGWSDAVEVEQLAAGRADQLDQFLVGGLLAGVDPLEVADQFRSDLPAGLPGHIAWPDLGQQRLAWAADRSFFAPPGISSSNSAWTWLTLRVSPHPATDGDRPGPEGS